MNPLVRGGAAAGHIHDVPHSWWCRSRSHAKKKKKKEV